MQEFITSSDRVYDELKSRIVMGELEPGARLVHRKLAEELRTSRIPIQEAIRKLEKDSLVICQPGIGARVKTWTYDDVIGTFAIREALDGVASRIFAEKSNLAQHARLIEYGKQLADAVLTGDRALVVNADIDLHMYVVKCANSPTLSNIAENCLITSATIRRFTLNLDDVPIEENYPPGLHDELIAALNSGDPDKAERVAREHVLRAKADMMSRMGDRWS